MEMSLTAGHNISVLFRTESNTKSQADLRF